MQQNRLVIQVDGLDLAYCRAGRGPPVVYIHGALTTLEEGWIGLGPAADSRFDMISFDRPGHGLSGGDGTTGSAWRQAELIHSALRRLGIVRPVIVGHSFGGAVAMALALQFPEAIAGVVALAPLAFPEPRLETIMFGPRAAPPWGPWLSLMAAPLDAVLLPILWRGMFQPQAMPEAFLRAFPFALAGGRSQVCADGQDALVINWDLARSAALYATCQLPVRVLQGDRDLVVNPLLHGRPLAALLPRGGFTSLPGLGHMAHHFAVDAVMDAIDEVATMAE